MALEERRAIEALRAGVPNADAVKLIDAGQEKILDRFTRDTAMLTSDRGAGVPGFILGGEFGAGKSHMIKRLEQEALKRGFVTSVVVVSKETPLSDLDLVYRAAIKELKIPDRRPGDLSEVVEQLNPKSATYQAFYQSVTANELGLDPLFGATLFLYEGLSRDDALFDEIEMFWAGGRIGVSTLKRELRRSKEVRFELKTRKNADLAPMRFQFVGAMTKAAGYHGWVIFIDEAETIAYLPRLSRAKSYINLMWLLGLGETKIPATYGVASATQEFTGAVFQQKQDNIKIPAFLAGRDPALNERAVRAMKQLDESSGHWVTIARQNKADLDRLYAEVRDIYRLAFDWVSESAKRPKDSGLARSMRMHMREWITRWDLERLDPHYSADIRVEALTPDLEEREGMEGFSEPDPSEVPDEALM